MRNAETSRRALSLIELLSGIAAFAVLILVGWVTWQLCWRQTTEARGAADAHRMAFGVLQRVEQEVLRASMIEVPAPGHGAASIRLTVPNGGMPVTRSFWLDGSRLMMQMESGAPVATFDRIQSLAFTLTDAPANRSVRIACTAVSGGQTAVMETVATKRN